MTNEPLTERASDDLVQDSDYDGAWKEALRQFLPAILECYFPAIAAAVDWEHPPEWFNKELSQILGQTGRRNRSVDVLVKLRLRDGGEQWILLHVEVQTGYEEGFTQRLALYNSGLFWIFKQRVVTLAVMADLREGWLPTEDRFQLADFESLTRFPVCKLIDRLRIDWQDDHSLPVQLARAQIAALRTAGDPEGRYRAKWQLVRNLYEIGYNAEQVREMFGLIDWMMHLRVDLEKRFKQELDEFEESLEMPYVTSVERIAKAEGKAELLLDQLAERFGTVPEELQQRIQDLPMDQLTALGKAILRFQAIEDLVPWLDGQSALDH
jgi:transcription termination factor NusB